MFTGIVQQVGEVVDARHRDGSVHLLIEGPSVLNGAREGDSIAVDGVCLTVIRHDGTKFHAEAIPATVQRTTLDRLVPGSRVNLEAAIRAGEPLGGHIVQGHVDGIGYVRRIEPVGDSLAVDVAIPEDVSGVTVLRGSIALSGVSLTVNGLPEPGVIRVSLIPYTLEHTTLGSLETGYAVNVEADVVAKLVAEQARRWLEARGTEAAHLNRS